MNEHRRTKRITDYLPITVTVTNSTAGTITAGPFSGRIIDISTQGACLLMTQIIQNNFHIFHTTKEDSNRLFQLSVNIPPDNILFSITALPVWMDVFQQDQIRAFKIGVEFTTSPKEEQMMRLQKVIKIQQEQRAKWWSSHTDAWLPFVHFISQPLQFRPCWRHRKTAACNNQWREIIKEHARLNGKT